MSVRYSAAVPDPGDTKACSVKHKNQMNNKIMKELESVKQEEEPMA